MPDDDNGDIWTDRCWLSPIMPDYALHRLRTADLPNAISQPDKWNRTLVPVYGVYHMQCIIAQSTLSTKETWEKWARRRKKLLIYLRLEKCSNFNLFYAWFSIERLSAINKQRPMSAHMNDIQLLRKMSYSMVRAMVTVTRHTGLA